MARLVAVVADATFRSASTTPLRLVAVVAVPVKLPIKPPVAVIIPDVLTLPSVPIPEAAAQIGSNPGP